MKQEVVTVGWDLAKSIFQVRAIRHDGTILIRRKLRRAEVVGFFADLPACLVGMEADLPPGGPSFIPRVRRLDFGIGLRRISQARRARSLQPAQASGARLRESGCSAPNAA